MDDLTPFQVDEPITAAAIKTGRHVTRVQRLRLNLNVLDERLYKMVPDKAKIRKLLQDGVKIAGAELLDEWDYFIAREDRPNA